MAAATLLSPLASAGPAAASDPLFVGWSNLLPAWTLRYSPSSENDCIAGRPSCVDRTIKVMNASTSTLAGRCDHEAVFALAYLRTTQRYKAFAAVPGNLADPAFVNHEDAVFARFYFTALDSWRAGDTADVPPAWKVAFKAADRRTVNGSGDLLLGMSAHVNRDLPFVLAGIGLVAPDGTSRKPDHDRINVMLNSVVGPLLDEEARRFDPTIDDIATPAGLSYTTMMQLLVLWRENAWRNAERLVAAATPAQRALVAKSIEDSAVLTARGLQASYAYLPPLTTTKARDAYCATHG